ncbi:MAG: DUF4340 domain-containing protein [Deltaproteobacteria bacterium]|nr:DUF4340 domain-containing protein [Deltaproteobacteria bacterium]MBW2695803.1 DUF4340 domain-containing protein [Deltaproteobacteria bacterium]
MSPRNTVLLFLAALLLGGFIYLYETSEEQSGETQEEPAGLVFPLLEADDIEHIRMTTSDGEIADLERDGEGWQLIEPLHFPADDVTVEGIASQLAQMEIAGIVQSDAPASDFGLAGEALVFRFRVASREGGLRVGRTTPVGSNTYVARVDEEEVFYVATWRINALRKTLTELRNRQVLEFDSARVDRISVSWPGARIELESLGDEWWMIFPVRERADVRTVETMLSDLSFLRADDFVDAIASTPEELGLDVPTLHVVLHGESEAGEPWTSGLMLGQVIEGRRVARGTRGALFTIAPERLDDFPRELIAWRVKELSRFAVADARSFDLTFRTKMGEGADETRTIHGELHAGEWTIAPEPMDQRQARKLVYALSQLEAVEIVAEDMGDAEREALGLAPPRLSVRVMGEGDTLLSEIGLGATSPGRGPFALRSESSVIYRIAEEDGRALPSDWSDFEARFRPRADVQGGIEGPLADPSDDAAEGLDDDGPLEETPVPAP